MPLFRGTMLALSSFWVVRNGIRQSRGHHGDLDFLILLLIAGVCARCAGDRRFFARRIPVHAWGSSALVGVWLQRRRAYRIFTIDVDGKQFLIIWSIIGGVLFAVVVGLLTRPTRRVVY